MQFHIEEAKAWWDFKGSGYDTKLYRCPTCDNINVIGYYEEPDRTDWYYDYRRKLNGRI
jgi:hypothetical protein